MKSLENRRDKVIKEQLKDILWAVEYGGLDMARYIEHCLRIVYSEGKVEVLDDVIADGKK